MAEWKYRRSDFVPPPAQLEEFDAYISFFEDRVEARGRLRCRALKEMDSVELDVDGEKRMFPLDRKYATGEAFVVEVEHVSHPDDVRLEGIYRDTTPPGCPQQYMSQCQQYGFQRILPVIDDCTAKCRFRTVLEGDARYTHMISNGDVADPDGLEGFLPMPPLPEGRRRVAYVNPRPMPPYLFLACAGTWDELADEVEYPGTGRRIRLEYLVPPGRTDAAREPMRILKDSVLFQHRLTGYEYPYRVYRTICMEKSLYGGMENTGNTTIVTDAALIDDSLPDRRYVYACGVIPHEYEHNHCGSGTTMKTVFDMWLNEAYTVNVERAWLAQAFGADFTRAMEIGALRGTGGAFAEEESGMAGAVVREGVNDPDEVVDAITYDKAPEVLNTLDALLGEETCRRCWDEYFRRFDGGNADTDDFLAVFSEVSGRDVRTLIGPYLFETGFPAVRVGWSWRDGRVTARIAFADAASRRFTVPVRWTVVQGGRDRCGGTFTIGPDDKSGVVEFSAPFPAKPDFFSWNRDGGFYGVLEDEAPDSELALQVRTDPNIGARADAMRRLRDRNAVDLWLAAYRDIFADAELDAGAKAEILAIPADSLARGRRALVRENVREMRALRAAAAKAVGMDSICAAMRHGGVVAEGRSAPLRRRAFRNLCLQLLSALDVPDAWREIERVLAAAAHATDRDNALYALVASCDPRRLELLEEYGTKMRETLNGKISHLSIVASDPHETVFEAMDREESREGWDVRHPALARALYCGFAANGDRLWTERGLARLERTMVGWAQTSEYNAIRLLAPLAPWRQFEPELRKDAEELLRRVATALPRDRYPFIGGKLAALLKNQSEKETEQ